MSLDDWQHGLHMGMQLDYHPALDRRNEEWRRACLAIIQRCVAPDMYAAALAMLDAAMMQASPLEESGSVRNSPKLSTGAD